jgi:site-specific recombinase XerD
MRTLGIAGVDELRQADHKAVIAWERFMREVEHAAASTIRRRLAALSSLYKHLVRHGHAAPGGDSHNLINKSVNRTPPDTSAIQTKLLAFRESHCFQASEENMAST